MNDKNGVETRLTAEQFWNQYPDISPLYVNDVHQGERIRAFAAAFRDKSEEENENWMSRFYVADGEIKELRAKLAEQERFTQDWRNATGEANKRTWAAEAEAAALREHERCHNCDHLAVNHEPHGYGGCPIEIKAGNGEIDHCPCNLDATEALSAAPERP